MSDQLLPPGCHHQWSPENVLRPAGQEGVFETVTLVICIRCYIPKPPIDITKPPPGNTLLLDSKSDTQAFRKDGA